MLSATTLSLCTRQRAPSLARTDLARGTQIHDLCRSSRYDFQTVSSSARHTLLLGQICDLRISSDLMLNVGMWMSRPKYLPPYHIDDRTGFESTIPRTSVSLLPGGGSQRRTTLQSWSDAFTPRRALSLAQ